MHRRTTALIMMFFLAATTAFADDYPTSTGRKLSRGLTNTLLGWAEIFKRQEQAYDQHGLGGGLIWGPLDGVGNAIKRTSLGIYETVTFPIQTSKNADPLIEPEFGPVVTDKAGYRPKDFKL